ncbi:MAG: glycosyltransferase family protein [Planctomycetota bacterium]|jgi:glycosyltransferase involved in cell wall biosynthesis
MRHNIRIVSTYPPRRCGIGTFARDLANALEHFTGEVGTIRVAAIDREALPYSIPVDLVIDQYDPQSWQYAIDDIIARAGESTDKTVVLLQHEYGLDPDDNGEDGMGMNFVKMTEAFASKGIMTFVYLHTVLDEPDPHQKKVLQELAKHSDGLIVTTESAVHILESNIYGIDHSKLKHIDHGIRMHHPSQHDRLAIKERYGLTNRFLATTLGMLSPDKGVQYGIRAYGRFLQESCTDGQRRNIVYLIAGQCHPDFIAADGGAEYKAYRAALADALSLAEVMWCRTDNLKSVDFEKYDVVFLDTFLDEMTLLDMYAATNAMLLPYLNMQQISSGILADTIGSGRVAVTTKSRYALELLHSNKKCPEGLVVGRHARGMLVDPGEPSVDQIAQALDRLVFDPNKRLIMERQAHQRGYQMRWHNTAWSLIQHIDFVTEEKEIISGRGPKFIREKTSILQRPRKAFARPLSSTETVGKRHR